jgi:hypothetical protein
MIFMTPMEWDICKKSGRVPSKPRECLLCLRFHMTFGILNMRANQSSIRVEQDVTFQLTRNPIDGKGAYDKDQVMRPITKSTGGGSGEVHVFVIVFHHGFRSCLISLFT